MMVRVHPLVPIYWGVGQLVDRGIWDAEAGSSSLPTPTRENKLIVLIRENKLSKELRLKPSWKAPSQLID